MNAYPSGDEPRGELSVRYDTSKLIIDFLRVITQEGDYQTAMKNALEVLTEVVQADRIYILEQQNRLDSRFFEHCAEGIPPRIALIKKVSDKELTMFVNAFTGCGIIFADTIEKLGLRDPRSVAYFHKAGVESLLIVPLRENGRFVGCLGFDNYKLIDGVETKWLLETIAPFLATVISNYQLLEELEWSVTHDHLTGLLNRRGMDIALQNYLSSQEDAPYALVLIDVDNFKGINDTYGHAAGDEALVALAKAMSEEFPEGSFLVRHGGDEMLVSMVGDDAAHASEAVDNFVKRKIAIECDGDEVLLTTSVGYTEYPALASTVKEAYRQADAALYNVKQSGKAAARRYSPELATQ